LGTCNIKGEDMKIKEWMESIDKKLMKLEINFENHLNHHRRVLTPMVIAILILLIGIYIRR